MTASSRTLPAGSADASISALVTRWSGGMPGCRFIATRASEHADVEIRALAIDCLRELVGVAPNAFADFRIANLPDGSEIAASPFALQS